MKEQNLFQNAAQILYGKKDNEEQSKSKERNDLLNELEKEKLNNDEFHKQFNNFIKTISIVSVIKQ